MDVMAIDLLSGGSHEALGNFYRKYLPIAEYEQILVGKKSVYDESVAKALNEVFLSWYLPANRAINAGGYAPTHDLEYEFSMHAYELLGMGMFSGQFFKKIINIK